METQLDLLREMRLTGGIFLDAEFTAPWCISARVTPEDCAPFTPTPRNIIAYHYVVAGRLFITVDGQPPMIIEAGEIVVLPRNDHHTIGSSPELIPVNADDLIQPAADGGLARIVYGGGGEPTQILCGFLGNDMPRNALIALLPGILKLNVAEGASGNWIESTFKFAVQELAGSPVKAPAIVSRLAEILFMEAVRRYFESPLSEENKAIAAINDPVVTRALNLIHDNLPRRWTTETLAREAGLSRSAFADRFTRAVGEPPMGYIARLRLGRAATQLVESTQSIARIASDIGYESEAAFNRAFKREYGVPPAAWRKNKNTL